MMVRAQPLMGTLTWVKVDASPNDPQAQNAVAQALQVMAHISRVMSAHDPHADLGRMARAAPGQRLVLDAHTVQVLRAAQHWVQVSGGAFQPVRAARILVARGARPGLIREGHAPASLCDVRVLSNTEVWMHQPVSMDFGGIAKGYAVDQAIEVLQAAGISRAIVNAGGDLRMIGTPGFDIDLRHAGAGVRERRHATLRRPAPCAVATSVGPHPDTEFVRTLRGKRSAWQSATVMAPDCMTADVLTKWALQSSVLAPELRLVLRKHRAQLWRSRCSV
jgi:thiamine biosynthesis lipoprotein